MDKPEIIRTGGAGAFLLDLFFPNRCPFCDTFIPYNVLCCTECFNGALWADETVCLRCGRLHTDNECEGDKLSYDMCIPAAFYSGSAKEAVLSMKYRKSLGAGELFGRVLRGRLDAAGVTDSISAAVPVPMTPRQRRERGYNQAETVLRAAVKGLDIPVYTDLLIRQNVKAEQHELGARERAEAVGKQYSAREDNILRGQTVMLADDVLTTGSTMNYCAYLLKEKLGADRVICIVCTTVRHL